jgi:hypothetical protein
MRKLGMVVTVALFAVATGCSSSTGSSGTGGGGGSATTTTGGSAGSGTTTGEGGAGGSSIAATGGATSTGGNPDAGVTGSGSSVVVSGVNTSGIPFDIIDPSPSTDMRIVAGGGEMVNFYSVASARTLVSFAVYMTGVSSGIIGCVVFESAAEDGTYQPLGSFQSSGSDGLGYVDCSGRTFSLKAGYFYAIGVFFGSGTFYYHSTPAAFPIATSFGALISAATRSLALGGVASFPWSSSTWLYFPQILWTTGT